MSTATYHATDEDQLILQGADSIEEAWREFHAANPEVYDRLVALARTWLHSRPDRKLGIGMLYERLRWDLALATTGEPLKLNNNYRALYAREIMRREPDLAGLFETRRLRREPEEVIA